MDDALLQSLSQQIYRLMLPQIYPGMTEAGNIDLMGRPKVKNKNGGTSTVFSTGVEMDGHHYLLPRVTDDGRVVSTPEAVKIFKKTGKHLGRFSNPEASNEYAEKLHRAQEKLYLGEG
jgi:hypothetical protein